MINKCFFILLVFILYSCESIDLVLKENNISKYKNNTQLVFNGVVDQKAKEEFYSVFGSKNKNDYILLINFSEIKENRLVKKNQVAEKIDYEISINYELYYKDRNCKIITKSIISDFSLVQKSSGYNYGTDALLDKRFRSNIRKNIYDFVGVIPQTSVSACAE